MSTTLQSKENLGFIPEFPQEIPARKELVALALEEVEVATRGV